MPVCFTGPWPRIFGCVQSAVITFVWMARRIETLVDPDSFEPMDEDLQAVDPLSFVDLKAYPDRINRSGQTGQRDAVRTGHAYIHAAGWFWQPWISPS